MANLKCVVHMEQAERFYQLLLRLCDIDGRYIANRLLVLRQPGSRCVGSFDAVSVVSQYHGLSTRRAICRTHDSNDRRVPRSSVALRPVVKHGTEATTK